ncbi:hypothetical protein IEQ34_022491 [Dendrobium chrysotoxum]|uniref:Uncharacterized protein n=1 Tax=Dendrobium chrysotoxum TaxID=161865 RepID=A0AAV7FXD6_DENCH|nr:hypothetical protein IEQ34_022491 [Dendrobium chrysotoxum]
MIEPRVPAATIALPACLMANAVPRTWTARVSSRPAGSRSRTPVKAPATPALLNMMSRRP